MTEHTNETSRSVDNLAALGLSHNHKRIRLLWMYPDTLSLHGGRGDIMALLRFATMARLPLEVRRVENLTDPVPLDDADMLYFCCGDLSCMPDVIKALEPRKADLADFAATGKVIVANGSTGAILSNALQLMDGTVIPGLGLLGMRWTQRETVHGDDLWLDAPDGIQVIGNEIRLADVTLEPGQEPFATVRYGFGNNNTGTEGAMTRNVIYTGCLGPVLVRNPALAMALLKRASAAAEIPTEPDQFRLSSRQIPQEEKLLEESKVFIRKKMRKQ